jgi:hypothetical protein
MYNDMDKQALSLVKRMIALPDSRISIEDVLSDPYLSISIV